MVDPATFFLLVEHFSTPDPAMAFKALNYVMRLWDKHIKEAKNAQLSPLPLPFIFPIIYFNGQNSFKGEQLFLNLFGQYKERVAKLFNAPLLIIDISLEKNEDLRGKKRASLLAWCMRYSMQREFLPYLAEFGQYVQDIIADTGWTESDGERAKVMIEYILRSLNTTADNNVVIDAIHNLLPPELEGTMATLAQQLFRKGKVEGKTEGKTEGIQKTLTAISLIKAGKNYATISQETGLELTVIEKLCQEMMD